MKKSNYYLILYHYILYNHMNCVFPYENLTVKKKKIGWFSRKKLFSSDNITISGLLIMFAFFFLWYIITVNISSTQWYFYDQTLKAKSRAEFKYNITKLNNLSLESELWNKINFNTPIANNSIEYIEVRG